MPSLPCSTFLLLNCANTLTYKNTGSYAHTFGHMLSPVWNCKYIQTLAKAQPFGDNFGCASPKCKNSPLTAGCGGSDPQFQHSSRQKHENLSSPRQAWTTHTEF